MEKDREVTVRAFSAYRSPLDMVNSFRYLGRLILAAGNNWLELVKNLSRARVFWRRMTQILIREGAEPRLSGCFLKAVDQAVLLFGSET